MSLYSQLSQTFSLYLSDYKGYLGEVETFLESEEVAQRAICRDLFDEVMDERLTMMAHFYPDILRKSFFLALYSLTETELKNICGHVEKRDNLPLSLDDISVRGGFTEKIEKYLERLARVKFPRTFEWAELENYRKLRNCVMHNQGQLASGRVKDNKHLRDMYIPNQSPLLSIDDNDTVIFNQGFCERVIDTLDACISQLCMALDSRSAR